MASRVQEHPALSLPSGPAQPFRLLVLALPLLFAASGCTGGGSRTSGDHAGQVNTLFRITPATAMVPVGQSFQFSASSPWGGGALWTVLPASGGSISKEGIFTASNAPGQCQIVAFWINDVRYTATADVSVVALPPPALPSSGLVQAWGRNLQVSPDGSIRNATVAGEPVPNRKTGSADGSVQLRHGFHLPPAH
jgi:hypothetical protein